MSLVRRFAADLIDITDVMPLRQSLVWYGNIFRHLASGGEDEEVLPGGQRYDGYGELPVLRH